MAVVAVAATSRRECFASSVAKKNTQWSNASRGLIPLSPVLHRSASLAMTSYGVYTNWYVDSSTIDHVTSELEKLTIHDKYGGHNQVHSASGAGMEIDHIGSSTLHTPTSNIHLNRILHVPKATKNLLSVHHLACDNNAFLEFHPRHFSIKEQGTRKTLLNGRCEGGFIH
jgi:hypothetical protein